MLFVFSSIFVADTKIISCYDFVALLKTTRSGCFFKGLWAFLISVSFENGNAQILRKKIET